MPSLVDATRETGGLDAKRPASETDETRDVSVAVDGGGGAGDGGYLRRKVPMKEEFRQMVQENKMRSEALRRSVHAIESLSAALDANNAEKQLLVTVLLSLTQQASDARDSSGLGRRGPREGGKPAQVAFVSEMVGMSMQERGVLEHMSGQVVDAVEDALRLKMAHAETRVALAHLDAQLMEWQTWYSSTARVGGEDSVRTKVPRLPVEKIQATPRIHGSEQPRDWQDGPVAAAHVRSQLSAVCPLPQCNLVHPFHLAVHPFRCLPARLTPVHSYRTSHFGTGAHVVATARPVSLLRALSRDSFAGCETVGLSRTFVSVRSWLRDDAGIESVLTDSGVVTGGLWPWGRASCIL